MPKKKNATGRNRANRKGAPGPEKVSVAQAIREVLVHSINRGQFPLAIVGLIVLVIIWRMSPGAVDKLAFNLIQKLENWSYIGYVMSGLLVVGWMLHARWQRRVTARELRRVTEERNRLQEKLLEEEVQSSEKSISLRRKY